MVSLDKQIWLSNNQLNPSLNSTVTIISSVFLYLGIREVPNKKLNDFNNRRMFNPLHILIQ